MPEIQAIFKHCYPGIGALVPQQNKVTGIVGIHLHLPGRDYPEGNLIALGKQRERVENGTVIWSYGSLAGRLGDEIAYFLVLDQRIDQ